MRCGRYDRGDLLKHHKMRSGSASGCLISKIPGIAGKDRDAFPQRSDGSGRSTYHSDTPDPDAQSMPPGKVRARDFPQFFPSFPAARELLGRLFVRRFRGGEE